MTETVLTERCIWRILKFKFVLSKLQMSWMCKLLLNFFYTWFSFHSFAKVKTLCVLSTVNAGGHIRNGDGGRVKICWLHSEMSVALVEILANKSNTSKKEIVRTSIFRNGLWKTFVKWCTVIEWDTDKVSLTVSYCLRIWHSLGVHKWQWYLPGPDDQDITVSANLKNADSSASGAPKCWPEDWRIW